MVLKSSCWFRIVLREFLLVLGWFLVVLAGIGKALLSSE